MSDNIFNFIKYEQKEMLLQQQKKILPWIQHFFRCIIRIEIKN